MSIRTKFKKCPKCGTIYSWNPDVGHIYCPECMGIGSIAYKKRREQIKKKLKKIFRSRNVMG